MARDVSQAQHERVYSKAQSPSLLGPDAAHNASRTRRRRYASTRFQIFLSALMYLRNMHFCQLKTCSSLLYF